MVERLVVPEVEEEAGLAVWRGEEPDGSTLAEEGRDGEHGVFAVDQDEVGRAGESGGADGAASVAGGVAGMGWSKR